MTEPVATAPATVPIVTREGQVGHVPEADLATALKMGASLATEGQVRSAEVAAAAEEKFGALTTPVAGAAALARGATLGLSDVGIGALGGGEALAGLREAAPITSFGGELAGNIAPLLLSGGGSAAARGVAAAGAPVRGAAALGRGAEALAARALGEGGTVLGRVARDVGARALGSAAEFSTYGAGHALSESVLEDHPLTAEELFAAAGGAALFGGALGGFTAAPFAVAREGAGYASKALGEGARALAGNVKGEAAGLVEKGKAAVKDLADRDILGRTDQWLGKQLDRVDVKGLSDEWAARSTYGRKSFVQEAEARLKAGAEGEPGGWAGVGRVLKDTGVIDTKAGALENALSPEDLAPRIDAAVERIGSAKGDLIRNSTGTVKVGELATALEDVIGKTKDKAGFEGITKSLQGYRDSLYDKLGAVVETPRGPRLAVSKEVPVQELVAQRRALDDLVFKEAKALDPNLRVEFMRDIRRGLADVEEGALVKAGADPKELARLNRQYQALRIAQDATDDSIARGAANRSVGATDYLSFVGGSAAGGPLLGGALGLANKVARERGSAAGAVFLHDLAETRSLLEASKRAAKTASPALQANAQALGKYLTDATAKLETTGALTRVAEMTSKVKQQAATLADDIGRQTMTAVKAGARGLETAAKVRNVTALKGYATVQDYERRRKDIEALAAPGALSRHLEPRMASLSKAAPSLAAGMAAHAQRVLDYARETAPPRFIDEVSLTPFATHQRASTLNPEEQGWMRALRVLDDPMVALQGVKDGTLTPDEAAALRNGHPELFQAFRKSVMARVAARPPSAGPIPYQTATRMALLLDAPTHGTLTPEFTASIQALNDPLPDDESQEQQGQTRGPPRTKPLHIASPETPMERLEARA